MTSEILDRIELRRIGGQELKLDTTMLARHEVVHKPAALLPQAVPDNKHISMNMPQQMRQEDHYLRAADSALGADRVLFADDYPYVPSKLAVEVFEKTPMSDSDRDKIYHLNAERWLNL
jgi:hypothetical protein